MPCSLIKKKTLLNISKQQALAAFASVYKKTRTETCFCQRSTLLLLRYYKISGFHSIFSRGLRYFCRTKRNFYLQIHHHSCLTDIRLVPVLKTFYHYTPFFINVSWCKSIHYTNSYSNSDGFVSISLANKTYCYLRGKWKNNDILNYFKTHINL